MGYSTQTSWNGMIDMQSFEEATGSDSTFTFYYSQALLILVSLLYEVVFVLFICWKEILDVFAIEFSKCV